MLRQFLRGALALVAVLFAVTLIFGPTPPYPGCKPVCVIGQASGNSCIDQGDTRHKGWGTACNSVETYAPKVIVWWASIADQLVAWPPSRFTVLLVFGSILLIGSTEASRSARALKLFSKEDDVYERRGAAPQTLKGLWESWKRVFSAWLVRSNRVFQDIGIVLLWGYLVPATLFVILIQAWTWFSGGAVFFSPSTETGSFDIATTLGYVGHQLVSAATFGLPEAFGWTEPGVHHDFRSSAVAWSLWSFFLYVAWFGSVSFVSVVGKLAGNLLSPCAYKFNRFARYRMGLTSTEPSATVVPSATI